MTHAADVIAVLSKPLTNAALFAAVALALGPKEACKG